MDTVCAIPGAGRTGGDMPEIRRFEPEHLLWKGMVGSKSAAVGGIGQVLGRTVGRVRKDDRLCRCDIDMGLVDNMNMPSAHHACSPGSSESIRAALDQNRHWKVFMSSIISCLYIRFGSYSNHRFDAVKTLRRPILKLAGNSGKAVMILSLWSSCEDIRR